MVVMICISLITHKVEQVFIYHFYVFLGEVFVQVVRPFFFFFFLVGLFICWWCCWVVWVLYIVWIFTPCWNCCLQISSHSVGCLLFYLKFLFLCTSVLVWFSSSHLFFTALAFKVKFITSSLRTRSIILLSMFSSM